MDSKALLLLIVVESVTIYVESRHLSRPAPMPYMTRGRRTQLPPSRLSPRILQQGIRRPSLPWISPVNSVTRRNSGSRQFRAPPYRLQSGFGRVVPGSISRRLPSEFRRQNPFRISTVGQASPATVFQRNQSLRGARVMSRGTGFPVRSSRTARYRHRTRTIPIRTRSPQIRQLLRYGRVRAGLTATPAIRNHLRRQRSRQVRQQRSRNVPSSITAGNRYQISRQRLRPQFRAIRILSESDDDDTNIIRSRQFISTNSPTDSENVAMHLNIRSNSAGTSVQLASPYNSAIQEHHTIPNSQKDTIQKSGSNNLNVNLDMMLLENVFRETADIIKQSQTVSNLHSEIKPIPNVGQRQAVDNPNVFVPAVNFLYSHPGFVFPSEAFIYPETADTPDSSKKQEMATKSELSNTGETEASSGGNVLTKDVPRDADQKSAISVSVDGFPVTETIAATESVVVNKKIEQVKSVNPTDTVPTETVLQPEIVVPFDSVLPVDTIVPVDSVLQADSVVPAEHVAAVGTIVPVDPATPVESVVPVETTVPVDYIAPVETIVPAESVVLHENVVPVKNVVPVDAIAPVETIVPIDNVVQVESVMPVDSVTHVESVFQVESAVPTDPVAPVESLVPAETIVPVEPVIPVDTTVPVNSVVSGGSAVLVDTILVDTVVSADTIAPVDTVVPVDTVYPADAVAPADTVSPADTIVTVDTVVPVDSVTSAGSVTPVDTIVSADTVSPADTIVPVDTVAQVDTVVPAETVSPAATIVPVDIVAQVDTVIQADTVSPADTIVPVDTVAQVDTFAKQEPLIPVETFFH